MRLEDKKQELRSQWAELGSKRAHLKRRQKEEKVDLRDQIQPIEQEMEEVDKQLHHVVSRLKAKKTVPDSVKGMTFGQLKDKMDEMRGKIKKIKDQYADVRKGYLIKMEEQRAKEMVESLSDREKEGLLQVLGAEGLMSSESVAGVNVDKGE